MEKEIMTNGYIFYSTVNQAETWRDEDNIQYNDFLVFTDFNALQEYVVPFINYLNRNKEDFEPITEIELDQEGRYYFTSMGSWSPTYCIEPIEINKKFEIPQWVKDQKEFAKWARELGF